MDHSSPLFLISCLSTNRYSSLTNDLLLTDQIFDEFELSHASYLSLQKQTNAIYKLTHFKNFQILIKMSSSMYDKDSYNL